MNQVDEPTCVNGCKHFTGGEIKHHKHCPYYPDSLSELYDEASQKAEKLLNKYKKDLTIVSELISIHKANSDQHSKKMVAIYSAQRTVFLDVVKDLESLCSKNN